MGRREIIGNTMWPVPAQLSQKVNKIAFYLYIRSLEQYSLRS